MEFTAGKISRNFAVTKQNPKIIEDNDERILVVNDERILMRESSIAPWG